VAALAVLRDDPVCPSPGAPTVVQDPFLIEFRELTWEGRTDGGFRLVAGQATWLATRAGASWTVERPGNRDAWTLERRGEGSVREHLLSDGSGTERGRTARDPGQGAGECAVALADGRIFRIRRRGLRIGRLELAGWETSGAYWVASPGALGWRLEATVAGGALDRVEELLVLFAAEIAQAEETG
jgi:hypothetical protein